MRRLLVLLPLLFMAGAAQAQITRQWVRQSAGVPTSCPARTVTINTLTDILYVPNGSGGCDPAASATSTTPGGANTQVQFNDSGAFGGDAGLVYNKTTDTLTVGHILGGGSTPTCAAGGAAQAGTGATCSVVGTDSGGTITLNTGTGISVPGVVATVTFATAYTNAPFPVLSPSDSDSGSFVTGGVGGSIWVGTVTTTTFQVRTSAANLNDSTTYTVNYIVVGR